MSSNPPNAVEHTTLYGKATYSNSRLKDLTTLLAPLQQHSPFTSSKAVSEDSCIETYTTSCDNYKISLKLKEYDHRTPNLGGVKTPCTALDINRLLARMWADWSDSKHFSTVPAKEYIFSLIHDLPMKAFVMCSMVGIFQTEVEQNEYHILFSDAKYRCNAELSITLAD